MKIADVRTVRLAVPQAVPVAAPQRRPSWGSAEVANPMSR